MVVLRHCVQLEKHETAHAQHENEDSRSARPAQARKRFFALRFRRGVNFLRREDADRAAPRKRQRHEKQTHRRAHDDLPPRHLFRKTRGNEIGKREHDGARRQNDQRRARDAPLRKVGVLSPCHVRRGGVFRRHRLRHGCAVFRRHRLRHGCGVFHGGRSSPAQQFVHRHAENIGERHKLRRLGKRFARLPFGDRLVRDVEPVCKFLLRHPLSLAQGIQEVSKIVQSSTSQIFCTIIVSRSRAAVKYRG